MRTPIFRVPADHTGPCARTNCPNAAAYVTRGGRLCDTHTHPAHKRILRNAELTKGRKS